MVISMQDAALHGYLYNVELLNYKLLRLLNELLTSLMDLTTDRLSTSSSASASDDGAASTSGCALRAWT